MSNPTKRHKATKNSSHSDSNRYQKNVLILGASSDVLQKVMDQVREMGVHVEGSTNTGQAATQFDANNLDLIVFGSGIVGPISQRLKTEFVRQNSDVQFLDAFAPVALKQIELVLKDKQEKQKFVKNFRVHDSNGDYLLQADILKPCTVRVEVYKTTEQGASETHTVLIEESGVEPGPFECRIDSNQREHGHMIYMTFNDDEFCLYNMHDEMTWP